MPLANGAHTVSMEPTLLVAECPPWCLQGHDLVDVDYCPSFNHDGQMTGTDAASVGLTQWQGRPGDQSTPTEVGIWINDGEASLRIGNPAEARKLATAIMDDMDELEALQEAAA